MLAHRMFDLSWVIPVFTLNNFSLLESRSNDQAAKPPWMFFENTISGYVTGTWLLQTNSKVCPNFIAAKLGWFCDKWADGCAKVTK